MSEQHNTPPLSYHVEQALDNYFLRLDGHHPTNLHGMVTREVEKALFKATMRHVTGNQTIAARLLGISRSTLHKKLKQYSLL